MPVTYYGLLGVAPDAGIDQIRRAFNRFCRECDPGNLARFADGRLAYQTLASETRRADYNRSLQQAGLSAAGVEALDQQAAAAPPVLRLHDLAEAICRQSRIREWLLDRIRQNAMARAATKSQLPRQVSVEIVLSPQEAAGGGHLPIDVPVAHVCDRCTGTGSTGAAACPQCDGHGMWWQRHRVNVMVPPHVADATRIPVSLSHIGIHNLYLVLHVRVTHAAAADSRSQ